MTEHPTGEPVPNRTPLQKAGVEPLLALPAETAFAPTDLFDETPGLSVDVTPGLSFPVDQRDFELERAQSLGLGRLAIYPAAVTGLGVLFKLPTTSLFLLPFIGLGLSVATRSARIRPFALTAFSSAFAAQATSIFITPFTWPLRFGFFAALFGGVGGLIHSQIKHL